MAEPITGDTIMSLLGQPLSPPAMSEEAHQAAEANLATARHEYEQEASLENTIWYGRRLAYLFHFEQAIAVYGAGLKHFPNAHQLYRHRGHRYITTRRFELARTDFERAAGLSVAQPIELEPDGVPNRLNRPLSTSHFNIWYHYGLAHYLLGDFAEAARAYQTCLQYSDNDDCRVATLDWFYMTLRRLGEHEAATELLTAIQADMQIIENGAYHRRLLMYKGLLEPAALLPEPVAPESDDVTVATQGYGVGNWYLANGDHEQARAIFERVLQTRNWAAFGYIAAEVELATATGTAPVAENDG